MALVLTDGTTTVSLEPEYKYKVKTELLANRHRSRNGALYTYKMGSYKAWDVPLMYVTSSTASTLNTWWQANTILSCTPHEITDVTTVAIVNKEQPLNEFILPYDTLYTGKLELESY